MALRTLQKLACSLRISKCHPGRIVIPSQINFQQSTSTDCICQVDMGSSLREVANFDGSLLSVVKDRFLFFILVVTLGSIELVFFNAFVRRWRFAISIVTGRRKQYRA